MQTQNKKGRGRPAGSLTLETVKLSELIEKFGPDTQIPVGRLWLQGKSLMSAFTPVATQAKPEPVAAPENKVEMSLIID